MCERLFDDDNKINAKSHCKHLNIFFFYYLYDI